MLLLVFVSLEVWNNSKWAFSLPISPNTETCIHYLIITSAEGEKKETPPVCAGEKSFVFFFL